MLTLVPMASTTKTCAPIITIYFSDSRNEDLHYGIINKYKKNENTPEASNNYGMVVNSKLEHYAMLRIIIMEEEKGI